MYLVKNKTFAFIEVQCAAYRDVQIIMLWYYL